MLGYLYDTREPFCPIPVTVLDIRKSESIAHLIVGPRASEILPVMLSTRIQRDLLAPIMVPKNMFSVTDEDGQVITFEYLEDLSTWNVTMDNWALLLKHFEFSWMLNEDKILKALKPIDLIKGDAA